MYSGGNEKTAAKSFVEITRLCTIRRHTKKAAKLNLTKMWPVSSFGFAGMERRVAPSAVEGVRSQATGASCPMGGRCVTPSTEFCDATKLRLRCTRWNRVCQAMAGDLAKLRRTSA